MARIWKRLLCAALMLALMGVASAEGKVVRLGDYRAIAPEMPEIEVEEAEVDAEIEFMLSLYARPGAPAPELTDEFAREKLGSESAAAYRERLRGIIREEKTEAALQSEKERFMNELIELSELELDESALDELAAGYRAVYEGYAQQAGTDWQGFCEEYFGMSVAEFEAALREQAKYALSSKLLLAALAEDMGVQIQAEAFQSWRDSFQEAYGLSDEELRQRYPDEELERIYLESRVWEALLD